MQTKNIIVVNAFLTHGGAERVMTELMNEWNKRGHRVTFVSWMSDAFPDEYALDGGVNRIDVRHNNKSGKIRQLLCSKQMISLLRKEKNTTVIAMIDTSIRIVAFASIFSKCRIIFSERCDPKSTPEKWSARVERLLYFNMADVCVFQTEEAKSFFSPRIQKKGVIIPNPINPLLPTMFEGKRRKVVVAVCRLTPEKNIPMLLEAFKKFSKQFPDFILEIYGRSAHEKYEQDVRLCIERLRLQERTRLMGFVSNVYDKMKDCTMYVSSSDIEGISNSLMEAMGLGLPVIATDCPAGGSRMLIRNGENGILIPMGDVESLYQGMIRIASDQIFAKKLSLNAYGIREMFKAEKIAEKWLDII